jgi:hypothetical protein
MRPPPARGHSSSGSYGVRFPRVRFLLLMQCTVHRAHAFCSSGTGAMHVIRLLHAGWKRPAGRARSTLGEIPSVHSLTMQLFRYKYPPLPHGQQGIKSIRDTSRYPHNHHDHTNRCSKSRSRPSQLYEEGNNRHHMPAPRGHTTACAFALLTCHRAQSRDCSVLSGETAAERLQSHTTTSTSRL